MRAIPASEHACFDVELDSGLAVRTRSIMQTMLMRSVRGRFATLPCVGHHSLILITRHPSRTLGDTPSCLLHTNCQCSERLLDAEEAGPAYILNCQPVVVALLPVSAPRDCHDHPPECAPQRERGARETWRGRRGGGNSEIEPRSGRDCDLADGVVHVFRSSEVLTFRNFLESS